MQASEQTGGIFDVTCAPLINLWGFGFTKFDSITPQLVDSIRHFVGFRKVRLQGNRVMKDDPRILLNFSALGGGTICNIIACLFDRKGISNYMIDIGGEMIAKGKNPQGWNWCIGIVRPKDDSTGTNSELEQIVQLPERLGLATMGGIIILPTLAKKMCALLVNVNWLIYRQLVDGLSQKAYKWRHKKWDK